MSLFPNSALAAAVLAIANPVLAAPVAAKTSAPLRSATTARDVGGFTLGMPIREANAIALLTSIGGNQFDAAYEGRSYNFEVTPKGRIYRITASQKLGTFAVDHQFTDALAAKLSVKYGKPTSRGDDTFSWELIEPVKHMNGQVLPFNTMWMSASVSHGGGIDDVSLEMTMLDFRILWQDEAPLNREPRDAASAKITL